MARPILRFAYLIQSSPGNQRTGRTELFSPYPTELCPGVGLGVPTRKTPLSPSGPLLLQNAN